MKDGKSNEKNSEKRKNRKKTKQKGNFLEFFMSKVFTIFSKVNIMKNTKIIIPAIIIAIIIITISITSFPESQTIEIDNRIDEKLETEITPEIQEKLDEIEKNVEYAKNLEDGYDPAREREWITSGPFQIDRTEYVLGEKIFLRIGGLSEDEIGQVVFLMPSNGTHYTVYISIPFNGADKTAFNYYVEPDLSKNREICSVDDLVGEWKVLFRGTDYPDLEFNITGQILPGDEEDYEPVC